MARSKNKDQARIAFQIAVPASEAWLYRNPEAIAAVRRGLQEAAKGRAASVGSFEAYVNEEEL
jgi:predicted transcriptional regulator